MSFSKGHLNEWLAMLCVIMGLWLSASPADAYSNSRPWPHSILEGGPHRSINRLAVERFLQTLDPADVRRAYAATVLELSGPRIVERSAWMDPPCEMNRALSWQAWVEDGGFSADEPELFNSFRHFYDPVQLHPDRMSLTDRTGVAYLTDHTAQIEKYLNNLLSANLVAKWCVNVRVDARTWAIRGEPGDGGTQNKYSWDRGREYFAAAFTGKQNGKQLSAEQRERLYAQSWRALGETAHLLADMTCVPHVRNDSHPGVSLNRMVRDTEKTLLESVFGDLTLQDDDPKTDLTRGGARREASRTNPDNDPNRGILKNDPYELYATEAMVLRMVPEPGKKDLVPMGALKTLNNCKTPDKLFETVATFTNRHFFSADTIPFLVSPDLPDSARWAEAELPAHIPSEPGYYGANGLEAYSQPWIDDRLGFDHLQVGVKYTDGTGYRADRFYARTDDPNGFYWAQIWEKKVRLCHRSWLSAVGWAGPEDALAISFSCINDQASVLIPLAVTANARLIDLFVPKLELRVDKVDKAANVIHGTLKHLPHGAFERELFYDDPSPALRVCVDGQPLPVSGCQADVKDGKITVRMKSLDLREGQKLTLQLDVGGFRLVSPPQASGLAAWLLTGVREERLQEPFEGPRGDDPAWQQTWSSKWQSRPCVADSLLQARWNVLQKQRDNGLEHSRIYRGTDTFSTRISWICPRRIANVMNMDASSYKLVPLVVAALETPSAVRRAGEAPPDASSWNGTTTVAFDTALVAPNGKTVQRNQMAALLDGMPLSQLDGEEPGVLSTDLLQFRFDPQWWATAYTQAHGEYPAELTGGAPGQGWKMLVTLFITQSLGGLQGPPSQQKRAYIYEYTFDPAGGAIKLPDDEIGPDVVKHLGVKQAGPKLLATLEKLRLLEEYNGPDFAGGKAAKPLITPLGPGSAPIHGTTRLRELRHVPSAPTAEQKIAFALKVENPPADASYSWNFGDPPGKTQADTWTGDSHCSFTYFRPGTFTITIVVRDKKNYAKVLDKQSWQITVAPKQ